MIRSLLLIALLASCAAWPQTPVPIDELLATLPEGVSALEGDTLETVSFHAKEGSATGELVDAPDEPGGHVFRVIVSRKTEHHWEIGMNWLPEGKVAQDDVLLFAFRARSIAEDQTVPGQVNVGFRRVEKPYSHSLSTPQNIGGPWKQYVFAFSPDVSTGPKESLLIMNFGSRTQARLEKAKKEWKVGTRKFTDRDRALSYISCKQEEILRFVRSREGA